MEHAASGNGQKDKILYAINTVICLFFIFGFGMLPPVLGLEPLGMTILGIFLGMLYGWTFIGFIWPSILGLIALGLSDYSTVDGMIKAGFSNTTITLYCLFLLVMARFLDNIGLSKKIAYWFVSQKINIGRPWVFASMFWLASFVLGATVSLFASIFLMWSIFYGVCEITGFKPKEKYPVLVLVGVVYAAMLGYALFPFKALGLMVLNQFSLASGGLSVDFLDFTIVMFAIGVACLAVWILVCKFVFRPDVTPLLGNVDHFSGYRGEKMTKEQWIGAIFLILYMFAMFAPSIGFLKVTWLGGLFTSMGTTGSLVFMLGVLAIIKIDGKPIFDFQECAKGIQWDIIIMFVATMPVASALESSEAGVMTAINTLLEPLFHGMGPLVFTVVFLMVGGILTQFAHNVVLAVVMTPIAYNFAVALGANPFVVVVLLAFAVSIAVATPGGSAMGALIYLNTDWIGTSNAYKYCFVVAAISLIMMCVVGIPVASLVF